MVFITELHSFQNHRERHLKQAFLQAGTPVKDTREKLVEKHYWHLLSNILDEPRSDGHEEMPSSREVWGRFSIFYIILSHRTFVHSVEDGQVDNKDGKIKEMFVLF